MGWDGPETMMDDVREAPSTPEKDQIAAQVRRIAESSLLRGSDPLRKMLQVFLDQAVEHPGEPLKEYAIATLALGRANGYDPRTDATVRVQVGRLRAKLAEYYQAEGADDPVNVEIPRGSYVLVATLRPVGAVAKEEESVRWSARLRAWAWPFAVGAVVVAAGWVLVWMGQRPPTPLRQFWGHYLARPAGPVIVFSNPKFTGNPNAGLKLVKPGDKTPGPYDETYTGVGEVFAMQVLTANLQSLGLPVRPKTAQMFTWDEAKANDLVVLGSPWQNQPASDLPRLTELPFKPAGEEPVVERAGVLNAKPKAGEEVLYRRSWQGANTTDYAVIAYLPGAAADRRMLCLQGITTASTQAAAEFVCRPDKVKRLMEQLPKRGSDLPFFEALIRVAVRRGVPVDSDLVLVRVR